MPEPQPAQSPLARLVLFMIVLALAGSVLAGAHYYTIDIPAQQKEALQVPENTLLTKCKNCQLTCSYSPTPFTCLDDCDLLC
jgi:hypothetical protein